MLNLNSFENLASILQSLGKVQKLIGIFVQVRTMKKGNGFLSKMMMVYYVYRCKICNEAIYGREKFDSHLCSEAYNLTPMNLID